MLVWVIVSMATVSVSSAQTPSGDGLWPVPGCWWISSYPTSHSFTLLRNVLSAWKANDWSAATHADDSSGCYGYGVGWNHIRSCTRSAKRLFPRWMWMISCGPINYSGGVEKLHCNFHRAAWTVLVKER